jgi:NAD(P)-dependent dehydrogenase (short-subunit alcohol dehydrogenase family)
MTRGLPEPPPDGTSALPAGTFEGHVVLVTGGGTGLGKAIGVEFARLGASVAIASRSGEHRDRGREAIEGAGADAISVELDVRDPDQIATAFDAVEAELGLPSVLVNNAAGNFPVPAEDLSPNGWRAVVGIVLDGTFFCSREFGRRHLATGSPGSIVSVGASFAWTGGPGFVHAASAKAGVKAMTETLAVEWAPYGIRVNCLVPGLMPHEDEPEHIKNVPGRGERDAHSVPALRVGYPRELGWAATFLASPYAGYITGETLVVDGANWQRRTLMMPEFTPLRDQLGKDPFTP